CVTATIASLHKNSSRFFPNKRWLAFYCYLAVGLEIGIFLLAGYMSSRKRRSQGVAAETVSLSDASARWCANAHTEPQAVYPGQRISVKIDYRPEVVAITGLYTFSELKISNAKSH